MSDKETAFMNEIDARFPYDNPEQCKALIDRGIAISPNAAFGALHEICRPPFGVQNLADQLMPLLDYWRSHFDHPAADMLKEVAASMILGQDLLVEDVIARMGFLTKYSGLYAALAILYFACDDVEGRLEPIDAAIRDRWNALANDH
jgi:hypothetical protein